MLNLKKGLALVLAAATAFTFAPVASLDASAKTIVDWGDSTLSLIAGDSKTIKVNDLVKLPNVGNNYVADASIADPSVAGFAKISKPNNANELDAYTSANKLTASAIDDATDLYSSFGTQPGTDVGDNAKALVNTGTITITGRKEGTTTMTLNVRDIVNRQVQASETITINVGRKIAYIQMDKNAVSATKVGKDSIKSNTHQTQNFDEIGISQLGNVPSLEPGYEYKLAVKSSNEDVAVASFSDITTQTNNSWNAYTGKHVKIEYKGAGSTTVSVVLTSQKTDGTHVTEIASQTIAVDVTDATDTLSAKYDGNWDGVLDTKQVYAGLGVKHEGTDSIYTDWANNRVIGTPYGSNVADGKVGYDEQGNRYISKDNNWYLQQPVASVGDTIYLDTVSHKSIDITANDTLGRSITFTSSWSGITVDNNGHVEIKDTALAHDNIIDAVITVSVPYTGADDKIISSLSIEIPVVVSNKDTTDLSVAKESGEVVAKTVGGSNLSSDTTIDDLPVVYLSLKDKKSTTLQLKSNAGTSFISGATFDGLRTNKASDVVSYSNGVLTALKPGKAVVRVQARSSANTYGTAYVYFVAEVTTKNANNVIKVDPSVINLTAANKTASLNATSTYKTTLKYEVVKAIGDKDAITSSDLKVDSANGNVEYTSANTGVGYIRVSGTETGEAVAPDAVYVTVNYSSSKAANTLKVTSDKTVNLKAGETAKIVASGTSVTYKSGNEDIATVDAGGTITAKAVGATVITVSSPEDATHMAGVDYVTVIVGRDGEAEVKAAKVTGVKVKNQKGAKVQVTWDGQETGVLYRVYKKVGNASKWTAKNVVDPKATLSVKKGAKVQVKVKAFTKNDGKTVWGPKATKAKTFKTDKK